VMAVARQGDAMAAWIFNDHLMTTHYTPTGWSEAREIKGADNVDVCTSPSLVADGDDFVMAWGHDAGDSTSPCLIYSSRWHAGNWTDPELRSDASTTADGSPSLHVDAHGNIMLLWTVNDQLSYARYNHATGAWTAAAQAFATVMHQAPRSLTTSENGTLMMAYEDDPSVFTALFR
jgi:hypothetical protein